MSRDQVLDKFCTIKGAWTDGVKQERYVYIEGTRDDRVLLVAHADTVWGALPIEPDLHAGIVFSKKRHAKWSRKNKFGGSTDQWGVGIGADDRAGCEIVWRLRELGHSLLITTGEEIGCVASRRIMNNEDWHKIIASHQFAVQFDRHGKTDIVFYDVGTKSFAEYVKKSTGFIPVEGLSTDIRFLCQDICGVNMSVGYYDEHTSDERLVLEEYENTFAVAHNWLKQPQIPKFPFSFREKYEVPRKNYFNSSTNIYDSDFKYQSKKKEKAKNIENSNSSKDIIRPANRVTDGKFITCSNVNCNTPSGLINWFENNFLCPKCGTRMY
jgi:hypothetical protein